MPHKILDLVGRRFGRLRVTALDSRRGGYSYWRYVCDCGNEKTARGTSLNNGSIRSCGCLHREQAAVNVRAARVVNLKSGMSKTATYATWHNMKMRCLDPESDGYKTHGARGIAVCERWMIFENFLADMGIKPKGLTLERTDNNGNYEPGNCRWATMTEQSNNRRSNRIIEYQGRSDTVANWARKFQMPLNVLGGRIHRGWPVTLALTTPLGTRIQYGTAKNPDKWADRSKCARGHPMTVENTYTRPDGCQVCKECIRENKRKYRARAIHCSI